MNPQHVPLPDLDDHTWGDLVDEARRLIPGLDPGWTDHNPSEPGMVLVELLAWLTEILIYRTNQVSDDAVRKFLKLLDGKEPARGDALEPALRDKLGWLRRRHRAVSPADFEQLAVSQWPATPQGFAVRRALAVPRLDLTATAPERASGHLSLLVVPPAATPGAPPVLEQPAADALAAWLEPRRLLGTRVHVVGPRYVHVELTVHLKPAAVEANARRALRRYFDPLEGGDDGRGWPFGRRASTTDVHRLLGALPGLERIRRVVLRGPAGRRDGRRDSDHDRVQLAPWELIWLDRLEVSA